LQQAARQHQRRRQVADGGVARHAGDQQGAGGHQRQCDDQALAAADAVDVGAEDDGAERAHQETGAEGHEGQHQRGDLVVRGEEGLGDGVGVKAEQEEIEHLHEVAADDAEHGAEAGWSGGGNGRHGLPLLFGFATMVAL
jgi:hypothetical protein